MVELMALLPSLLLVQLFQRLKPRHTSHPSKQQSTMSTHTSDRMKSEKEKQWKLTFPWWFVFVAYGFSLLLVVLAIFFIIIRGIELGDLKTQQWLTSILAGFFSSIFLTQPLKVYVSQSIIIVCFFIDHLFTGFIIHSFLCFSHSEE